MGVVFDDKGVTPDAASVEAALGPALELWRAGRQRLVAEHGPFDEEWAWSGKAGGWSLRLKRRGRAIVYLTPWAGECRVGCVLGEAAVEAARHEGIDPRALALFEAAPRYPEGRGVRLSLRDDADLDVVAALVRLKLAH